MIKKIDGGVIVGFTASDIEEKKNAEIKVESTKTVDNTDAVETPVKSAKKPLKRAKN